MHNAALHWVDGIQWEGIGGRIQPYDRWMTASEHLLAMGIAYHTRLSNDIKCCTITSPADLAKRNRQDIVAQTGNTMHVCVAYAVLLFPLACVCTVDQTNMSQLWH
jgi:hypothetical protein